MSCVRDEVDLCWGGHDGSDSKVNLVLDAVGNLLLVQWPGNEVDLVHDHDKEDDLHHGHGENIDLVHGHKDKVGGPRQSNLRKVELKAVTTRSTLRC